MANTERLNGARALRRIFVVAVTMATTVAGVVVAPGGHPARAAAAAACSEYAQQAIDLFATGRARGCSHLTYPVWSDDFQYHYRWCLKAPDAEVRRGADLRRRQLENCIGQGLPVTGSGPGPDEVVFYEKIKHVGRSAVYRLKPENRWEFGEVAHLPFAEPDSGSPIGSYRLGSNVGVVFFNRSTLGSIGKQDDYCDFSGTALEQFRWGSKAVFKDEDLRLACEVKSFIIFRRNEGLVGAGWTRAVPVISKLGGSAQHYDTTSRFFPVPRVRGVESVCYPDLRLDPFKLGFGNIGTYHKNRPPKRLLNLVDLPFQQSDGVLPSDGGYNSTKPAPRLKVDLFTQPNCQGSFLRLPGANNRTLVFEADYFAKPDTRYRSLRVHWTGGNDRQAVATGVSVAVNPTGVIGNMPTEAPSGNARKAPEAPDPKTATATGVVTGVIGQGTAPAQATGQADAIHRHDLLQVHADRMVFRVHYTLSPQHPMPVYGGAFLMNGSKKGGGFRPVTLSRPGTGRFEITVNLTSDRSRPDAVEFFLYEGGQHPFVRKRFNLP